MTPEDQLSVFPEAIVTLPDPASVPPAIVSACAGVVSLLTLTCAPVTDTVPAPVPHGVLPVKVNVPSPNARVESVGTSHVPASATPVSPPLRISVPAPTETVPPAALVSGTWISADPVPLGFVTVPLLTTVGPPVS